MKVIVIIKLIYYFVNNKLIVYINLFNVIYTAIRNLQFAKEQIAKNK
jgi:hypothetical protein